MTVFLIAGIFHLFYFNWKVFFNYFKKKVKSGTHHRYELLVSLIVFTILLGGTMWEVPGVFSIVNLGEDIKASYEVKDNEPPVPHAEDLTISEFSETILNQPVNDVIEKLREKEFTISNTDQTIKEIAESHNIAPSEILVAIQGDGVEQVEIKSYTGFGRKTVSQTCDELEIN